ncbi:hydrogenase nickel incorporation protein HypB [Hafnia alvei]|uniref:hydrogenase nickel incorporation protein HypB n=1 Tax=Hafnia alvei TaxID=569 RepID=UPI001035298C|nr:hydrogenase nickel incorporation protein HypB [Hafnia alvei]MDN6072820.1 hydrogenase nickel incorporation protein HypB [Enterobacterales bacterium]TBL94480.1 hydrogenase nickel incorporation protein HypB [Hafnia alvei]
MCTTCGCAAGEQRIEGDDHHDHDHHHEHGHHHDHHHGHEHGHDHSHEHHHDHSHEHGHHHHEHEQNHEHGHHHGHQHQHSQDEHPQTVVVHHHYHHTGDVHHHHYNYVLASDAELHLHDHKHKHKNKNKNKHAEKRLEKHLDKHDEKFTPEQQDNDLHYGKGEAGSHAPGMTQRRMLQIEQDVLGKNNHLAEHNREHFTQQHIAALNLVSSPGSGKTTLLTETLKRIADQYSCAVIEGDQQTTNDAERIRATGVPAIQVNTGKGCHLDAQMVHDAMHRLNLPDRSLLFIENVGNLVCPASFDLGERHKVAVLSVTEGEDKPLKYPHMFAASSLMIINKIDLLPYLHFDVEACIANAKRVNPQITVIQLSATSGEGMDAWLAWLETNVCA